MSINQQAFNGWVLPEQGGPTPVAGSVVMNVVPSGAIDGSNKVFALPLNFTEIALYLNGVRQIDGTDFVPLAAASGPGYDRIFMTLAPDAVVVPDVLTADLTAA